MFVAVCYSPLILKMGLDTWINYEEVVSRNEQIYNKLVGEKEEQKELLYWRKCDEVVDWFGSILGTEIENCENYEIDKAILEKLLYALENGELEYPEWCAVNKKKDIKTLKAFIKKKDFTKIKLIFTNWW